MRQAFLIPTLAALLALAGCTGGSISGSAGIGSGTKVNLGAAIDGSGAIRPRGSISQRLF